MATEPKPQEDPVEGSPEKIDKELERQSREQAPGQPKSEGAPEPAKKAET